MFKDKNVLIAAAAGTLGGGLLVWGLTKLAAKFADKSTPAAIIKDPVVAKAPPAPAPAPDTYLRPTAVQDGSAEFYACWQNATRIPFNSHFGVRVITPLLSEDFSQFPQGTQLSMMDPFGVKYLIVTGHRSVGNLVIREEYVDTNLILFQYLSPRAALELNCADGRFLGVQFLHRAIGFLSTYVQPQAEGMTPGWIQRGLLHSSILQPHPLGYARTVSSEANPVKDAFLEIWRASEPLPADTPDGRYTNLDQFGIPVLTKEYAPGKTLKWYNGRCGKAFTVVGNDKEENVVFCERPSTTYIGYSEDIVRFSDGETTVITEPATFEMMKREMAKLAEGDSGNGQGVKVSIVEECDETAEQTESRNNAILQVKVEQAPPEVTEAFDKLFEQSQLLPVVDAKGNSFNLSDLNLVDFTGHRPGSFLKVTNRAGLQLLIVTGNKKTGNAVFIKRDGMIIQHLTVAAAERTKQPAISPVVHPDAFVAVSVRFQAVAKFFTTDEEQQASDTQDVYQHGTHTYKCEFPSDSYGQIQKLFNAAEFGGTGLVAIENLVNWPMNKRPGFIARLEYGSEYQVAVIAGNAELGNLVVQGYTPSFYKPTKGTDWQVTASEEALALAAFPPASRKIEVPRQLAKLLALFGFYLTAEMLDTPTAKALVVENPTESVLLPDATPMACFTYPILPQNLAIDDLIEARLAHADEIDTKGFISALHIASYHLDAQPGYCLKSVDRPHGRRTLIIAGPKGYGNIVIFENPKATQEQPHNGWTVVVTQRLAELDGFPAEGVHLSDPVLAKTIFQAFDKPLTA